MYYGNVNFNEIPEIGFAHQFYSVDYGAKYGKNRIKCIEIVYVNSGSIKIKFEKEEMYAQKGDIMVLFRHLTMQTKTYGDEENSHCTVLAEFSNYDFSLFDENVECEGFVIPFVTKGCRECEEIGKRIYKMADMIARGESVGFYRALGFEEMPWEWADLAAASEDCDRCIHRVECGPVPMRLTKE